MSEPRPTRLCIPETQLLLHADAPWLLRLLQHSTTPAERLWLFQTCRELRDSVLQSANYVTLSLNLQYLEHTKLSEACDLLASRTAQPCKVAMHGHGYSNQAMHNASMAALQRLQHVHVTGLSYGCRNWATPDQFLAFLSAAATSFPNLATLTVSAFLAAPVTAFPHLTTLTVSDLSVPLPPPAKLPNLAKLDIVDTHVDSQPVALSVAQLLPQLIHLKIRADDQLWQHVFSTATTTLAALVVHEVTDELLDQLVQRTPALQTLEVADLDHGGGYSQSPWALASLRAYGMYRPGDWEAFRRLPRTTANQGVLEVHVDKLTVSIYQGANVATLLTRLHEFRFVGLKAVDVDVYPLDYEDQEDPHPPIPPPEHMGTLLSQLALLKATPCTALQATHPTAVEATYPTALRHVVLKCRHVTSALAQAVTDTISAHPHLSVRMEVGCLTDDMLDALMQHGPRGQQLAVRSIRLTSDRHSAAPWPWQRLEVRCQQRISLKDLAVPFLPNPAGGVHEVVLQCGEYNTKKLTIALDEVPSKASDLVARLGNLQFTIFSGSKVSEPCFSVLLELPGAEGSHQGSEGSHQGSEGSHQGSEGSHQGSEGSHQGSGGQRVAAYQAAALCTQMKVLCALKLTPGPSVRVVTPFPTALWMSESALKHSAQQMAE